MLSWKDLLEVLSRSLDLSSAKRATLVARIQAMQKPAYSFPPGDRVGKGAKATYTPDQLFQLVYVFRLLDIGVPPGQAIGFVMEQWPTIARATGRALLDPNQTYPYGTYLVIRLGALDGLRDPDEERYGNAREADPQYPFKTRRGIVALQRNEMTEGHVSRPEWFDGTALIYVPGVAKRVERDVSSLISDDAPFADAAKAWVAA